MEEFCSILCQSCESKEATVECDDCTPSAETEPMLLCAGCSSLIHHGRMGKHTVLLIGIKEKKQSLEIQLLDLERRCHEFTKRKKQLSLVKDDIKERSSVYEKCIRERLTALIQQLRHRGNEMFKTLKGISQERIKQMEQAERFANVIIREVAQASKEVQQLDKEPGLLSDKLDDKIQSLKHQLSEINFDQLLNLVPSSRINHSLDEDLLNTLAASIDTLDMTVCTGKEETTENADTFKVVTREQMTFCADSITEGDEMTVNVSCCMDHNGSFFVTPLYRASVWEQMLDHSHRMRWEYVCNIELEPIPESFLQKGLICYALRNDNMWYRAVIQEIQQPPEPPGFTACMADFGIVIQNIQADRFYEYRVRDGVNLPFQAIHCKLAAIHGDSANVGIRMRFIDHVKEQTVLCRFITPVPKTKENANECGTKWVVDLFLEKPKGKTQSVSTLLERSAGDCHAGGEGSKFKSKDIRLADEDLSKSLTHITTTISDKPDSTTVSVKPDNTDPIAGASGSESDAVKDQETGNHDHPHPNRHLDQYENGRSKNSTDEGSICSDSTRKKKKRDKKDHSLASKRENLRGDKSHHQNYDTANISTNQAVADHGATFVHGVMTEEMVLSGDDTSKATIEECTRNGQGEPTKSSIGAPIILPWNLNQLQYPPPELGNTGYGAGRGSILNMAVNQGHMDMTTGTQLPEKTVLPILTPDQHKTPDNSFSISSLPVSSHNFSFTKKVIPASKQPAYEYGKVTILARPLAEVIASEIKNLMSEVTYSMEVVDDDTSAGQDIVPAEDIVSAEDILSAEDKVPAEDIVQAENIVPAEDKVPAEDIFQAEDIGPTEDKVPAEDVVRAENIVSAKDIGSAEDKVPADDVVRAEDIVPAEDVVRAENIVPAEDKVPADDVVRAEDIVSAEDKVPAEDIVQAENIVSAKDIGPADDVVRAEDIVPAEDKLPAENIVPAEDKVPAEDIEPAEDTEPQSDDANAVATLEDTIPVNEYDDVDGINRDVGDQDKSPITHLEDLLVPADSEDKDEKQFSDHDGNEGCGSVEDGTCDTVLDSHEKLHLDMSEIHDVLTIGLGEPFEETPDHVQSDLKSEILEVTGNAHHLDKISIDNVEIDKIVQSDRVSQLKNVELNKDFQNDIELYSDKLNRVLPEDIDSYTAQLVKCAPVDSNHSNTFALDMVNCACPDDHLVSKSDIPWQDECDSPSPPDETIDVLENKCKETQSDSDTTIFAIDGEEESDDKSNQEEKKCAPQSDEKVDISVDRQDLYSSEDHFDENCSESKTVVPIDNLAEPEHASMFHSSTSVDSVQIPEEAESLDSLRWDNQSSAEAGADIQLDHGTDCTRHLEFTDVQKIQQSVLTFSTDSMSDHDSNKTEQVENESYHVKLDFIQSSQITQNIESVENESKSVEVNILATDPDEQDVEDYIGDADKVLLDAIVPPPELNMHGNLPDLAARTGSPADTGWEIINDTPMYAENSDSKILYTSINKTGEDWTDTNLDASDSVVKYNVEVVCSVLGCRSCNIEDRGSASNSTPSSIVGQHAPPRSLTSNVTDDQISTADVHTPIPIEQNATTNIPSSTTEEQNSRTSTHPHAIYDHGTSVTNATASSMDDYRTSKTSAQLSDEDDRTSSICQSNMKDRDSRTWPRPAMKKHVSRTDTRAFLTPPTSNMKCKTMTNQLSSNVQHESTTPPLATIGDSNSMISSQLSHQSMTDLAESKITSQPRVYQKLPQLSGIGGSTFEVYVVGPLSAEGIFMGQLARSPEAHDEYDLFMKEVNLYGESPRSIIMQSVPAHGQTLLAKFRDKWYRARFAGMAGMLTTVFLLDVGLVVQTDFSLLRNLPPYLQYVPQQSVRCSILFGAHMGFTRNEREIFRTLTQNVKLRAMVTAPGGDCVNVLLFLPGNNEHGQNVLDLITEQAELGSNTMRAITRSPLHIDTVDAAVWQAQGPSPSFIGYQPIDGVTAASHESALLETLRQRVSPPVFWQGQRSSIEAQPWGYPAPISPHYRSSGHLGISGDFDSNAQAVYRTNMPGQIGYPASYNPPSQEILSQYHEFVLQNQHQQQHQSQQQQHQNQQQQQHLQNQQQCQSQQQQQHLQNQQHHVMLPNSASCLPVNTTTLTSASSAEPPYRQLPRKTSPTAHWTADDQGYVPVEVNNYVIPVSQDYRNHQYNIATSPSPIDDAWTDTSETAALEEHTGSENNDSQHQSVETSPPKGSVTSSTDPLTRFTSLTSSVDPNNPFDDDAWLEGEHEKSNGLASSESTNSFGYGFGGGFQKPNQGQMNYSRQFDNGRSNDQRKMEEYKHTDNYIRRMDTRPSNVKVTCSYCYRVGHMKTQCPNARRSNAQRPTAFVQRRPEQGERQTDQNKMSRNFRQDR